MSVSHLPAHIAGASDPVKAPVAALTQVRDSLSLSLALDSKP